MLAQGLSYLGHIIFGNADLIIMLHIILELVIFVGNNDSLLAIPFALVRFLGNLILNLLAGRFGCVARTVSHDCL